MPAWVEPMKALLVSALPREGAGNRWGFEIKWDGVRALAFYDGKRLGLLSRTHKDATFRYPELAELGKALGDRTAILDGEIIALDKAGLPSFPELQKRMNVTRPAAVEAMAREVPVHYMIFDLLYLDGRDLRGEVLQHRREKLESLAKLFPPACRLSPMRLGSDDGGRGGEEMLAIATQKNLEGVVAKRLESVYEAGERSGAWAKYKLVQRQELVVGGWIPQVSLDGVVKRDQIGALLLGFYDQAGKTARFHFAGAVGTGFTRTTSAAMVKRLRAIEAQEKPFPEETDIRKFRAPVRWVRPEVVVEVEYRRWPSGGLMQQAAFKGLRSDKPAKQVVREMPAEP